MTLFKFVKLLELKTAVFQDLDRCSRNSSSTKAFGWRWEEEIEVGVMGEGLGRTAGKGTHRAWASGMLLGKDSSMGATQEEFQSQKPQALVIHAEGEG